MDRPGNNNNFHQNDPQRMPNENLPILQNITNYQNESTSQVRNRTESNTEPPLGEPTSSSTPNNANLRPLEYFRGNNLFYARGSGMPSIYRAPHSIGQAISFMNQTRPDINPHSTPSEMASNMGATPYSLGLPMLPYSYSYYFPPRNYYPGYPPNLQGSLRPRSLPSFQDLVQSINNPQYMGVPITNQSETTAFNSIPNPYVSVAGTSGQNQLATSNDPTQSTRLYRAEDTQNNNEIGMEAGQNMDTSDDLQNSPESKNININAPTNHSQPPDPRTLQIPALYRHRAEILEAEYSSNPFPSRDRITELCNILGIQIDVMADWFLHRHRQIGPSNHPLTPRPVQITNSSGEAVSHLNFPGINVGQNNSTTGFEQRGFETTHQAQCLYGSFDTTLNLPAYPSTSNDSLTIQVPPNFADNLLLRIVPSNENSSILHGMNEDIHNVQEEIEQEVTPEPDISIDSDIEE